MWSSDSCEWIINDNGLGTTFEHKGKGYYHDHPLTICWCHGWLTLTGSSRYLSMASFLTPSQRAFRGCVLSMLLFILIRNRHVSSNTFMPQKLRIPSRKNTTSVLGCRTKDKTVNKTLSIHPPWLVTVPYLYINHIQGMDTDRESNDSKYNTLNKTK